MSEIYAEANLVAYTEPTIELLTKGVTNLQEFIAYTARVSNPSNQFNTMTSNKLLHYLLKHKHWSPFEMVNAVIEVDTTRDIAHQLVRHRSMPFQEFSQRYADPTKDMQFITREARLQDPKNRQNSIEIDDPNLQEKWDDLQQNVINHSKNAYQWAIQNGIAKEQARAVLPEGLTTTRLYAAGTIRSWIHYIQTRSNVDTQKEHRAVALACARALEPVFPMIKDFVHD